MVIHYSRVCCGTTYFVLRPSIAFTMDFNVGDKVFCTRSNGVRVPATMVGLSPKGFIRLEYFQDAIRVVLELSMHTYVGGWFSGVLPG